VQSIQDIPIPTSVSAVRSLIGMVNYFRDFIPSLSSYLGPLTELTNKKEKFWRKRIAAFKIVKDQVAHHTRSVLMNASDQLTLYTDASTKAIGGVLMQVQGGREMPCVFVSHTISEQENR